MSGFDQMAGQLASLGKFQARLRSVGDVTSESGGVRKLLVDGPKSSEQLQQITGLTGKQVWGRLKYDLQKGRVLRTAAGEFALAEIDLEAIEAAIKLLRSNGYTVTRNKKRAVHE